MKIIGLTGPSGTGKSTLANWAKEAGFFVVDCDALAREASNNEDTLQRLEKAFPEAFENHLLNRKRLAQTAFSSKSKTEILNGIMLPAVVKLVLKKIEDASLVSDKILIDAPTLFESGLDRECDFVIAVLADESFRRSRIKNRDGLNESQLSARLNAAKPDSFYTDRTEHIIRNNGDLNSYKEQALVFLKG